MKIVILDGYTTNPGDLSWEGFKKLGEYAFYDRTDPGDIIKRAEKADIILVNKVCVNRELIEALPELKYIGILATGYNTVDLEAASSRNIIVTNIPAYSTPSVVQMVFAHILNFTQQVALHASGVREGKWSKSKDFCYWETPLTELEGKTMGIIGYGKIGREVAKLALAFGMNVVVNTRTVPEENTVKVRFIKADEVFAISDFISIHSPLTPETKHMVNRDRLEKMKKSAILINTGRGYIVDEQALADALNNGQIAGAGLDVLSEEPPKPDNPLIKAKNCVITPHIGWATRASRDRLIEIAIQNVKSFIEGNPVNVVND